MELNLSQKLTLLSLNDQTGKFVNSWTYLAYCLAGASILDLSNYEKIEFINKEIRIINNSKQVPEYLNKVLEIIRDSKNKSAKKLISRIGNKAKEIKNSILESLVEIELLKKDETSLLWVFKQDIYPAINSKPEDQLKERIHDILINNQEASSEELMLLSLMKHCGLEKELFEDKSERKIAQKSLKTITTEENIGKLVGQTIQEIHMAITAGITATIVASTITS